eukprot:scaffold5715_cov85-Skeletonema_marinoi.AAC.2
MVRLRDAGLLLEKESSAAGFLGVDIKVLSKDDTGRATRMELTQTGLIDRIITNLGLDDKNEHGKFTPAEAKPLSKDIDGPSVKRTSMWQLSWASPMLSTAVLDTCSVPSVLTNSP